MEMQSELMELYQLLKLSPSPECLVQKSTLVSVLLYNEVDKKQPQFFRYILRCLEKLPNANITADDYRRIFMTPSIDFNNVKEQDIADMFMILDRQKRGSISTDAFLKMYRETQSYNKIREQEKDKTEKDIKDYIKTITFDGSITPNDFYKIIKFTEQ